MPVTAVWPIYNVKELLMQSDSPCEVSACNFSYDWSHFTSLGSHESEVFEKAIEGLGGCSYWALGVAVNHAQGIYYSFVAEQVDLYTAGVVGCVLIKVYETPEGWVRRLDVEPIAIPLVFI